MQQSIQLQPPNMALGDEVGRNSAQSFETFQCTNHQQCQAHLGLELGPSSLPASGTLLLQAAHSGFHQPADGNIICAKEGIGGSGSAQTAKDYVDRQNAEELDQDEEGLTSTRRHVGQATASFAHRQVDGPTGLSQGLFGSHDGQVGAKLLYEHRVHNPSSSLTTPEATNRLQGFNHLHTEEDAKITIFRDNKMEDALQSKNDSHREITTGQFPSLYNINSLDQQSFQCQENQMAKHEKSEYFSDDVVTDHQHLAHARIKQSQGDYGTQLQQDTSQRHGFNISSYQRSRSSFQDQNNVVNSDGITIDDEYRQFGPLGSSANGKITNLSSNGQRMVNSSRPQIDRIVQYQRESSSSCGNLGGGAQNDNADQTGYTEANSQNLQQSSHQEGANNHAPQLFRFTAAHPDFRNQTDEKLVQQIQNTQDEGAKVAQIFSEESPRLSDKHNDLCAKYNSNFVRYKFQNYKNEINNKNQMKQGTSPFGHDGTDQSVNLRMPTQEEMANHQVNQMQNRYKRNMPPSKNESHFDNRDDLLINRIMSERLNAHEDDRNQQTDASGHHELWHQGRVQNVLSHPISSDDKKELRHFSPSSLQQHEATLQTRAMASPPLPDQQVHGELLPGLGAHDHSRGSHSSRSANRGLSGAQSPFNRNGKQPKQQASSNMSPQQFQELQMLQSNPSFHENHQERHNLSSLQESATAHEFAYPGNIIANSSNLGARPRSNERQQAQSHTIVNHAPLVRQQMLQSLSPQMMDQNGHNRAVMLQKDLQGSGQGKTEQRLDENSMSSEMMQFKPQHQFRVNGTNVNAQSAAENEVWSANSHFAMQENNALAPNGPQLPNQSQVHPQALMDPNESLSRPAIISQSSNQKLTANGRPNNAVHSPSGSLGQHHNNLALNLQLNQDLDQIEGQAAYTVSHRQNPHQAINMKNPNHSRQHPDKNSQGLQSSQNADNSLQIHPTQAEQVDLQGQHEPLVVHNQTYSQNNRGNTLLALSQSHHDTYSLSQQNPNQMSLKQPFANQSAEIDGLNLTEENQQEEAVMSEINDQMQHLRALAQQQSFRPSDNLQQLMAAQRAGQQALSEGRQHVLVNEMRQLSTIGHAVEDESMPLQRNHMQQQPMQEAPTEQSNNDLEADRQLSMSSSKLEQAEAQLQAEVDQIGLIYEQHKQIQNWQAQLRNQLLNGQESMRSTHDEPQIQSSEGAPAKLNDSLTLQQLAQQNLMLQQQAYQLSIGNTQQFLENMKENAANTSGQHGTPSNATKILSSIKNEPSQMQQQYQMLSPHAQDVNLSSMDFELARPAVNNSPKNNCSDASKNPSKDASQMANLATNEQVNKGSTLVAISSALGADEMAHMAEHNSFSINKYNDLKQDNSHLKTRDLPSSLSYSISHMQQPQAQKNAKLQDRQSGAGEWKAKYAALQQANEGLKERIAHLQKDQEKMAQLQDENQRLKKENAELKSALASKQHQMSMMSQQNDCGTKDSKQKGSVMTFMPEVGSLRFNKLSNASPPENHSKHMKNNSSSVDPEYSMQLNNQIAQMTYAMDTLKQQKTRLEQALREESKQNEVLKIKEKILKDSLEQKILTEQPALKALIKGSFARSSNVTVNDSRFTQHGKNRGMSQGPTTEEERQSKSFSSEMHSIQPFKPRETRESIVDNYLQFNILQQENQHLQRQVDVLSMNLEKEKKVNVMAQQNVEQTQDQLNQLRHQIQGNEDELGANVTALRAQLEASQQQITMKDRDIKFFKEQLQQYGTALEQAYDEVRKAMTKTKEMEQQALINSGQQSDLEEKQLKIAELQAHVENLKNQLKDFNSVRRSMQFEIEDGNQRVSMIKERFRGETSDKFELQKQIDDLQLANGQLDMEKKRLEDELDLSKKRHEMELESMKAMVDQNKNYSYAQEGRIRETMQKYQQEMLDQRSHYESQNLQNLDQISNLQQKIADLEQRLFSVQFEKTQADEDLQENQNTFQNLELEKLKCKQLLDKQRSFQTQMQSLAKRLQTFEKKHELNLQQIENLQSQNTWLKDEREKTQNEIQILKTDLKKQQGAKEDVLVKLNLIEQNNQDASSQLSHEVQRLSKAKMEVEHKYEASQDQVQKLEKQIARFKDEKVQFEKDIMTLELDFHNAQRNVKALEKELEEKREEGFMREQSEARVKRTIVENESLRSEVSILKKELQYSTDKTKEVQGRLREAEEEARQLQKVKRDFEEKLQQADLAKETHQEEILKQIQEMNDLKDERSRLQIELKESTGISLQQIRKIEELQHKIREQEKVIDDQRTELSLNMKRQNEITFRYEEGSKNWDAIELVKQQSMEKIVRPFLDQLKQQVDVSNILQEALFGIFAAEKENQESHQEVHESHNQLQYYERQTRELKRQLQFFEDTGDQYPKTDRDHVQTVSKMFEYIRFLQDQIISKLIGSVLESRSMNILDQKRFDSNTQIMKHQQDKLLEYEHVIRENEALLDEQSKKMNEKEAYEEHQKAQNAGLRQRVRDQVAEIDQLRMQLNIVQNDPEKTLGITGTTAVDTLLEKQARTKGLLAQSRSQHHLRSLNQTQPHTWREFNPREAGLPPAALSAHKYATKQQHRTEMDILMTQGQPSKHDTLFGRAMPSDKSALEGLQAHHATSQLVFRTANASVDRDVASRRQRSLKHQKVEVAQNQGYFTHTGPAALGTRVGDLKKPGGTLRAQLDSMMK